MVSKGPKTSKKGSAGWRKHVTFIPQKLETFRRLELGESCIVIMVTYNIGSSAVKDLGHCRYCLIICHLFNPVGARLKEFGCILLWNPSRL
jgi:hypothetical protein